MMNISDFVEAVEVILAIFYFNSAIAVYNLFSKYLFVLSLGSRNHVI